MIIDQDAYRAMLDHMRQAAPHEGVGLLAGSITPTPSPAERTVDTWVPLDNVAEFPRLRYEVDDTELVEAWQALEDAGRRPWIVCHSHVNDVAVPSVRDVMLGIDETLHHLVVSLAGTAPVARLWRLRPFEILPAERMGRVRYTVADLGFRTTGTSDLTHDVSNG